MAAIITWHGFLGRSGTAAIVSSTSSGGAAAVDEDALLAVAAVSKHFGGVRAVEDISLSVRRGGLTSVIGPNGAGKTSLFTIISGFYRLDTLSTPARSGLPVVT
jgi:ABC-type glutathione transport system ATPase component